VTLRADEILIRAVQVTGFDLLWSARA
jgi:hypothetical protein